VARSRPQINGLQPSRFSWAAETWREARFDTPANDLAGALITILKL
jgi:hypothetical protein